MGFGFEDFPFSKMPGRTKFKGGSIGLTFNSTSEKANLYVNKELLAECKIENAETIGLGISKISMEVFATGNGELVRTERVKEMGVYYPLVNLGNGNKVKVLFDE